MIYYPRLNHHLDRMQIQLITNRENMNRDKNNNRSNSIPSWQSRKMRTLIVERWQEVWQIVEARDKSKNYS